MAFTDRLSHSRRDVLTNPELVKTLEEENVLVWGGDVSERDGYQGALSSLSDGVDRF